MQKVSGRLNDVVRAELTRDREPEGSGQGDSLKANRCGGELSSQSEADVLRSAGGIGDGKVIRITWQPRPVAAGGQILFQIDQRTRTDPVRRTKRHCGGALFESEHYAGRVGSV